MGQTESQELRDARDYCNKNRGAAGCDVVMGSENFLLQNMMNQKMMDQNMMNQKMMDQNMMNQKMMDQNIATKLMNQNIATKLMNPNVVLMEIKQTKMSIEQLMQQINYFSTTPMADVVVPHLKNQLMQHEYNLMLLGNAFEQLNREGFAQVGSPRLPNNYYNRQNLINKKNAITSEELANARKMWGDALVAISLANDQKGLPAATQVAKSVINGAYGYNLGPVLFKPTMTSSDHTFRTTADGALSYFVGQNPKFPTDDGFALKGWREADTETKAQFIDGDVAMWMGIVTLTDKNNNIVKVDKSWGYKKGPDGKLRIVLHHSSLPYVPPK
jgi:hypothetical protein